jgi:hypothetical protein
VRPAALLLLLAAPAAAWWFGPKYDAFTPERPIELDGDARDWPAERRDDAADMTFAFAKDSTDLFVLFLPHTRSAKQQLAGTYGQGMTLWVDPKGGMARRFGLALTAPQKTGDGRFVRVVTAAGPEPGAASRIEVKNGDFDAHGALEARVPLELLGTPLPKFVGVGLETGKPERTPLPVVDAKGRSPDELFAAVRIWVRVKLPRPPKDGAR